MIVFHRKLDDKKKQENHNVFLKSIIKNRYNTLFLCIYAFLNCHFSNELFL